MSPIPSDKKHFFVYIYMYLVLVAKKVNLMVLFFPRLNLCNLSLFPEDNNGSQCQGFQSRQTKMI